MLLWNVDCSGGSANNMIPASAYAVFTYSEELAKGLAQRLTEDFIKDINMLTDLRLAYLQEDLGVITDKELIQESLPGYYEEYLNKDFMVYVARDDENIVSCAFLLIVEKPMSPSFITGKTGTVLNVYTKQEYRNKGYAKKCFAVGYKAYACFREYSCCGMVFSV